MHDIWIWTLRILVFIVLNYWIGADIFFFSVAMEERKRLEEENPKTMSLSPDQPLLLIEGATKIVLSVPRFLLAIIRFPADYLKSTIEEDGIVKGAQQFITLALLHWKLLLFVQDDSENDKKDGGEKS